MVPKFNSLLQLMDRFPDEKSCHQYLAGQRWDGCMECPREGCGGDEAWAFKDGIRYKCTCCKRIYTARTGTIFEASKLPLKTWFVSLYLVMHKKGISSIQLAKDVGITQKSAWFLLQRLRAVLGNEKHEKLSGKVELDEAYVGGKNKNRHHDKKVKNSQGRSYKDKTPVFGMFERDGKLRAMVIAAASGKVLRPIVYSNIEMGSTLMTDEFNVYRDFESNYTRKVVEHGKGKYVDGDCYTNTLEGFWSHLKRGITGIYHWASRKHLDKYVQEFVFKYNYRNLGAQQQMDLFIRNMDVRLKYKELVA